MTSQNHVAEGGQGDDRLAQIRAQRDTDIEALGDKIMDMAEQGESIVIEVDTLVDDTRTARDEADALRAALGELLASMQHDERSAADPENVRRHANAVSAAEALLAKEEAKP